MNDIALPPLVVAADYSKPLNASSPMVRITATAHGATRLGVIRLSALGLYSVLWLSPQVWPVNGRPTDQAVYAQYVAFRKLYRFARTFRLA